MHAFTKSTKEHELFLLRFGYCERLHLKTFIVKFIKWKYLIKNIYKYMNVHLIN
jgi:hypothetical protein